MSLSVSPPPRADALADQSKCLIPLAEAENEPCVVRHAVTSGKGASSGLKMCKASVQAGYVGRLESRSCALEWGRGGWGSTRRVLAPVPTRY